MSNNLSNNLLKQDTGILRKNAAISPVSRSSFIGLKPNIKDHVGF